MVEATVLKLWRRGHFQWRGRPVELHENVPIVSEFVGGNTDGRTNSRTGDLINLPLIFKRK
jgi:hypothetical protein